MVNKISRRVTNVLLTITAVFQLAAIVMPWWIIDVSGNDTEIQGIFYTVRCYRDDCKVKSIHDEYKDLIHAKERFELTHQNRLEIAEIGRYSVCQLIFKFGFVFVFFYPDNVLSCIFILSRKSAVKSNPFWQ